MEGTEDGERIGQGRAGQGWGGREGLRGEPVDATSVFSLPSALYMRPTAHYGPSLWRPIAHAQWQQQCMPLPPMSLCVRTWPCSETRALFIAQIALNARWLLFVAPATCEPSSIPEPAGTQLLSVVVVCLSCAGTPARLRRVRNATISQEERTPQLHVPSFKEQVLGMCSFASGLATHHIPRSVSSLSALLANTCFRACLRASCTRLAVPCLVGARPGDGMNSAICKKPNA